LFPVCVHFLKGFAAVFDLAMRHHLETLGLLDGVGARVRLKVGEDEIDSLLRGGMAVSKHLELEIPEDLRRLSEEAEVAIFRIIQASLTNVHLHSGVSEAHVKMSRISMQLS
jgi:signal transduction histidine kinase